jgi:hypothetical protein
MGNALSRISSRYYSSRVDRVVADGYFSCKKYLIWMHVNILVFAALVLLLSALWPDIRFFVKRIRKS